jgi:hypothetical protein
MLLSLDPKATAFDSFYEDFVTSPLSEFYKEYHGVSSPSYNLMGKAEYQWIREHLAQLSGSIYELGCGLSPIVIELQLLDREAQFSGVDFSKVAIKLMEQKHSRATWAHSHFTFLKVPHFDHGFSIDASYDQKNLLKIGESFKKTFLISRIHPPYQNLPLINGYTKKEIDFTTDYQALIMAWSEYLELVEASNPKIKETPAWQVICPEMKRHSEQLKQSNTKRTVTIYEKNL